MHKKHLYQIPTEIMIISPTHIEEAHFEQAVISEPVESIQPSPNPTISGAQRIN